MPGGRGKVDGVVTALNLGKPEKVADALIMAINEDGYTVDLSPVSIGRAINACKDATVLDNLTRVLCGAYKARRTSWEY